MPLLRDCERGVRVFGVVFGLGAAVHVFGYEFAALFEGVLFLGGGFGILVGHGGVEGWEDERGGFGHLYFPVAFAGGEFEVVGEFVGEAFDVGGFDDRVRYVCWRRGELGSGGLVAHKHGVEAARAEEVVVDFVEEGIGPVAALRYDCGSSQGLYTG